MYHFRERVRRFSPVTGSVRTVTGLNRLAIGGTPQVCVSGCVMIAVSSRCFKGRSHADEGFRDWATIGRAATAGQEQVSRVRRPGRGHQEAGVLFGGMSSAGV